MTATIHNNEVIITTRDGEFRTNLSSQFMRYSETLINMISDLHDSTETKIELPNYKKRDLQVIFDVVSHHTSSPDGIKDLDYLIDNWKQRAELPPDPWDVQFFRAINFGLMIDTMRCANYIGNRGYMRIGEKMMALIIKEATENNREKQIEIIENMITKSGTEHLDEIHLDEEKPK